MIPQGGAESDTDAGSNSLGSRSADERSLHPYSLSALGMAELRAQFTSDLTRIKDDIGQLYDKISVMKDKAASEQLALITQLNQEFTAINRRLGDFSTALERFMVEAEHNEESIAGKIREISLDIEKRLSDFRLDLSRVLPDGKVQAFDKSLEEIHASISRLEQDVHTCLDQCEAAEHNATELEQTLRRLMRKHVDASRDKIMSDVDERLKQSDDDLEALKAADALQDKKLRELKKKVTQLSVKVGLFVSVIGWLLHVAFGDSAKNIVAQLTNSKATTTSSSGKSSGSGNSSSSSGSNKSNNQ